MNFVFDIYLGFFSTEKSKFFSSGITKMSKIYSLLFILIFLISVCEISSAFSPANHTSCNAKDFGHGSIVCVCSEKYCDHFVNNGASSPLKAGQYAVYTSSKAGARFNLTLGEFKDKEFDAEDRSGVTILTLNQSVVYQSILGFGGAFTDAATINIKNVSSTLQEMLISSYYSTDGIEYNVGRIPIASCDFSTREYSYDDFSGDFELSNFSLAKEDLDFKIPLMQLAIKKSKQDILFFGSPWSAPAWMKTNGKMTGFGQLKGKAGGQYHKTWAMYFAKFIKAYEDHGVKIWGVTVQNEPSDGFVPGFSFQCMGFSPEAERDFIKLDLGPTLTQEGYKDVKIMILDDQRVFVGSWAKTILSDPDAAKYVSGIAVHWYLDWLTPASALKAAHNKFPDYFIFATEACTGAVPVVAPRGVVLGDWHRGEKYSSSIIEDLSNWVVGWMDWNLALNMKGGPNWVNNIVDAPIIVDSLNKVFYKQPMFYHLGHFTKFIPRGSKRISVQSSVKTSLQYIGFVTPESTKVVIILNQKDKPMPIELIDSKQGKISAVIPASSIQTYLWD